MTRRGARIARSLVLGAALVPAIAGVALAHPLGNFTINHYAGIRVEPSRVLLDVVIDEAEIPTFQATRALDLDGDGTVAPAEADGARATECRAVGDALELTVDGAAAPIRLVDAGLAFPPGNGGLSTMRIVCGFEAPLVTPIAAGTSISFRDGYEAARIGWREITVVGSGVTPEAPGVPTVSESRRLTAYPVALSAAPDIRAVAFGVRPGGATLPPFSIPDARPLTASGAGASSSAASTTGVSSAGVGGSVPGGDAAIPEALRSAPVTPLIAFVALLTAAVLGAGHALTPGHGKTLMAAYLVGTRGTRRHAVGLGMAVSVSHTLGILFLAAVVLAAQSALPPDVVVRGAPLVAAISIVLIGGWMLVTEARRWRARRVARVSEAHDHDPHEHGDAHAHEHADEHAHEQDHGHDHEHGHEHALASVPHEHSHGGVRHSHVPAAGATISWRSLFVLGLAGGLVPSASALLILLATIAAGRPAWGIVLVAAFGLGMAAVMTGVGLAFVQARRLLERAPTRLRAGGLARLVPAGAAVVVLVFGAVLTTQALAVARLG